MERKPLSRPYNCVQLILEDVPGGGTVAKSEFKATSLIMKEGALLSADNDGIYHLTKTAKVWTGAASDATTIKVYKNNEFLAGNILIDTNKAGISRTILSIDEESSFSYDSIELNAPLGIVLSTGDILIEVSAAGISGSNVALRYPPTGISICDNPVDLSKANTGCALLVRGRVSKELMPYGIDETLEELLPLIRFV
jgi:hypothetical protein